MKKNKLDSIYEDFNKQYKVDGSIDKEKLDKDLDVAIKKIEGITKSINKETDANKIKKMQEEIKKTESRRQNIEGYLKYSSQIEKIQKYKAQLSNKIVDITKKREVGKTKYQTLVNELNAEYEKMFILKKQNDPKETINLTSQEYDELQENIIINKEKIEKIHNKMKEIKAQNDNYDKKIDELKGKIGKCDLAWKTLFTNKDWDEIQRRSLGKGNTYVQTNQKKSVLPQTMPIPTQPAKTSATMPLVQKETIFGKFKNFIKRTANNIKNFFANEQEVKTNPIQKNIPQQVTPTAQSEKDMFIEGLRVHVDENYKQEKTEKKEKEYIEKHKIKEESER